MQTENQKVDIIEDILRKVLELKQTAIELEVIATKLKVTNQKKEGNKVRTARNQHPDECDICDAKFKIISDLEKHIKASHEDYQVFECYECSKKFVTEWRLQKHRKIHTDEKTKQCLYFKKKIRCPFDKFGCKFRHGTGFPDTTPNSQIQENSTKMSESTIDIRNCSRQSEDIVEFYSSSPKKQETSRPTKKDWFECEKCITVINTRHR